MRAPRARRPALAALVGCAAAVASAAAMSVRPETRAGGCGDTLSAAGNAFTGRFWSGPGGQLFCPGAESGQWVFMVDGRCTAELLTCETRTPSAHGDPRALPRLGEEPPVLVERQDTYAARQRKRARTRAALGAPTSSLNNLVLMIQFSDTDVSQFPPLSEYETLFNGEAPADGAAVASPSVRAVYKQMSSSRLNVNSVLSGWIKVPWSEAEVAGPCQPRRVAQAGDADGLECCNGMGCPAPLTNNMVQVAIKHALTLYERAVGAAIIKQQFDRDGDGVVDCFTVLQSGYGAETTGGDGALARSIWSHKYVLSAADWSAASAKCQGLTGAAFNRCSAFALPLSGLLFNDYSINPALWYSGRAGPLKISRVGVITHEIGHFLGLPDLYDVDSSSAGLGVYGLMSSSWGLDGSQKFPPSLSAPMKLQLGWVDAIDLVKAANGSRYAALVRLDAVQSSARIFTIPVSDTELFVIENRQPVLNDQLLPGGALIFHWDTSITDNSHEFDVTQPATWASKHPAVRLVQADGLYDLERSRAAGRANSGDQGDWWPYVSPTTGLQAELSDRNGLSGVLNINSYKNLGKPSLLRVSNFSASGATMTFVFAYEAPAKTAAPTAPTSPVPTALRVPQPGGGGASAGSSGSSSSAPAVIGVTALLVLVAAGGEAVRRRRRAAAPQRQGKLPGGASARPEERPVSAKASSALAVSSDLTPVLRGTKTRKSAKGGSGSLEGNRTSTNNHSLRPRSTENPLHAGSATTAALAAKAASKDTAALEAQLAAATAGAAESERERERATRRTIVTTDPAARQSSSSKGALAGSAAHATEQVMRSAAKPMAVDRTSRARYMSPAEPGAFSARAVAPTEHVTSVSRSEAPTERVASAARSATPTDAIAVTGRQSRSAVPTKLVASAARVAAPTNSSKTTERQSRSAATHDLVPTAAPNAPSPTPARQSQSGMMVARASTTEERTPPHWFVEELARRGVVEERGAKREESPRSELRGSRRQSDDCVCM